MEVAMLKSSPKRSFAIVPTERSEQESGAVAQWRADMWMLSELTRRQIDAALSAAQAKVAADEPALELELARHNRDRRRLDLPQASLDEFRQLVIQVVMHAEMMKLRTVK
jgi:hypothetical protein